MRPRSISAALTVALLLVGCDAPRDDLDGTTVIGRRVPRAEEGYAITLPDSWVEPFGDVRDTEVLGVEGEPESAVLDETTVLEGLSMWMEDPDSQSGENCQVWVEPDYQLGLEPMAEALMAEALAAREQAPETVSAKPVEHRVTLPAGEAVRIDYADRTWGPESHHSEYHLVSGTTRYTLICTASRPPGDRWLSIAETFEFLPTEE